MGETTTIAEVGGVQIIDDGDDDEYVHVYVDGEQIKTTASLDYLEDAAVMYSEDVQEALEKAREWYENGRQHAEGPYLVAHDSNLNYEDATYGFKIPLSNVSEETVSVEQIDGGGFPYYVAYDPDVDVSDKTNSGTTRNSRADEFGGQCGVNVVEIVTE